MASLILTIREGIRYRGRSGHYSWIAHRISGLAILGFLVIHVWDTANATYAPEWYIWSIELFKFPLFGVGEVALMGAVLYHAFNGLRITLLDFKPEWWQYQQRSATIVWAVFAIIYVPIAYLMTSEILHRCSELAAEGATCWVIPPLP